VGVQWALMSTLKRVSRAAALVSFGDCCHACPCAQETRPHGGMRPTVSTVGALLLLLLGVSCCCCAVHGAVKESSRPPHTQNATAWRECVARTPSRDRYTCSLETSRVLAEGLPPVFGMDEGAGLRAAAAGQDEPSDWIVVMDNDRASPHDIEALCDPALPGAARLLGRWASRGELGVLHW
jgi:hypothetical protein